MLLVGDAPEMGEATWRVAPCRIDWRSRLSTAVTAAGFKVSVTLGTAHDLGHGRRGWRPQRGSSAEAGWPFSIQ